MSIEVKCPNCGSMRVVKKSANEYQCKHCESTFRFIDPSHKIVLKGALSHNCPVCGAPVKDSEGYTCTSVVRNGFVSIV